MKKALQIITVVINLTPAALIVAAIIRCPEAASLWRAAAVVAAGVSAVVGIVATWEGGR